MDAALDPLDAREPADVIDPALDQLGNGLIDTIGIGIIVCNSAGVVQFTNRCADDELASGSLLCRAGRTLRCLGRSTPPLEAAIVMAGHKGCRQMLELSHARDRLLLSVAPWRRPAAQQNWVIVMLGRRDLCSPLTLELLCSANGLTLAEHRVLADLLHGRTPRDIAAEHHVALTTVRTQIASVQKKFGVHSVEALLLRVAEAPPMPDALHGAPFGAETAAHAQAHAAPAGARRH